MSAWYKICCPVDFSEPSRAALEEGADLARRFGGELALIHVFDKPFETGPAATAEPYEAEKAEREVELDRWKADAEAISGGTVSARVLTGAAAAEIVRFARESRCDLIVIGTHGRTGVRHLVLGSVAERVVREADCPVLVVRRIQR